MARSRVLFQGSSAALPSSSEGQLMLKRAESLADALGRAIINAGLDLVLTSSAAFDSIIGTSAMTRCGEVKDDPRERIRTYTSGPTGEGFGMLLDVFEERFQEFRTFVIQESDALVALAGAKGTADCVQKAVLAKKPVFPVATCGGASQIEWERLRRAGYCNRTKGDIDFLADRSLSPEEMAAAIATACKLGGDASAPLYSRRVFVVHGHDAPLKAEVVRLLERLDFTPVVLHDRADAGRTLSEKLYAELSDIGFALVLLTPDDLGRACDTHHELARARQNVIFEFGLLVGRLGANRVCAIAKAGVEMPSDLDGVLYKPLPAGMGLESIALDVVRELKAAGYAVDANRL